MCEIIRSLIHYGALDKTINLENINENRQVLNKIKCSKYDDSSQPGICAINPKSNFNRTQQIILLGGKVMSLFDTVSCDKRIIDSNNTPIKEMNSNIKMCIPNSLP